MSLFQLFSTPVAALILLLPTMVLAEKNMTPGSIFKDCETCPEMVVVPNGSFIMGVPDDEMGRQPDEGPMHEVTFATPFAISRFHVTVEEWQVFAKETGYILKNGDTRPGRECKAGVPRYPQTPRHPAVCVDYNDVKVYIDWLARKTNKPYRMLSESEWEYAARAGSTGPFPFPFDEEDQYTINKHANTYGDEDGYAYVSPVDAFPPNPFGFYDMHGNVWEWVADCWHDSYVGAPTDGSAWMESDGKCESRQIRGNDWIEPPIFSRSGNRNDRPPSVRGDWIGFRVARPI